MSLKSYSAAALIAVSMLATSHAKAQTAGTVFTGIAIYTVTCNNSSFVQYGPAKIVKGSNGVVTLKFLQESASNPSNAPVSVPGDGYIIFLIQPAQGGTPPNPFYYYTFTAGSQRSPGFARGTLALQPGTDGVTGLPNLGFQFSYGFTSGGTTCNYSFDGGAVAFQPGL